MGAQQPVGDAKVAVLFTGLLIRLFIWCFTRGWPVGLGLVAGGLTAAAFNSDALMWYVAVPVIIAGYVFKFLRLRQ